jgi:hypothetical protein
MYQVSRFLVIPLHKGPCINQYRLYDRYDIPAIDKVSFELDEPIGLLLATVGSKSKMNYGYRAKLQLGT